MFGKKPDGQAPLLVTARKVRRPGSTSTADWPKRPSVISRDRVYTPTFTEVFYSFSFTPSSLAISASDAADSIDLRLLPPRHPLSERRCQCITHARLYAIRGSTKGASNAFAPTNLHPVILTCAVLSLHSKSSTQTYTQVDWTYNPR